MPLSFFLKHGYNKTLITKNVWPNGTIQYKTATFLLKDNHYWFYTEPIVTSRTSPRRSIIKSIYISKWERDTRTTIALYRIVAGELFLTQRWANQLFLILFDNTRWKIIFFQKSEIFCYVNFQISGVMVFNVTFNNISVT